ncbi:unnamed protein product [Pylaiella littoralis]
MADDSAWLNAMEESVEDADLSPSSTGRIDGKQPGISHLNHGGKERGKCSSLRGLAARVPRPLLSLIAVALLVPVTLLSVAPDMKAQATTPGPREASVSRAASASPFEPVMGGADGPARLENIEVVEQAETLGEKIDVAVTKSGETTSQGQEVAQVEESTLLLQCYSSPAADPSEGSWKKVDGGVGMSPISPKHVGTGGPFRARPWANTMAYQEVLSCMGEVTSMLELTGTQRYPSRKLQIPHAAAWECCARSMCGDVWANAHRGEGIQPYWTWEASACTLDEMDAVKFCDVMRGRKGLLFVGDSLMEIMTQTLAGLLRAELLSMPAYSRVYSACGGAWKFAWYRNDYLDLRTTKYETMNCQIKDRFSTRCIVFATDSVLEQFDTLIVNSGAHRMEGGMSEYQQKMTAASKALTASMKRLHGESAILMVRNSVPGHWECRERMFEGPVELDVAITLVEEGPAVFKWPTYVEKNQIIEEAFVRDEEWKLLDAYTPTVLRADSHRGGPGPDCLHYCMPGPVDHWVLLLYNILLVETAD